MKILCVCNGGCVRSTALAEYLKGHHNHDAIAVGTYWTSRETMDMLCDWADMICPVDSHEPESGLPETDHGRWINSVMWTYIDKIRVVQIGHDHWGNAQCEGIRNHVKKGWDARQDSP